MKKPEAKIRFALSMLISLMVLSCSVPKEIAETELRMPDIESALDGHYTGEAISKLVSAEVELKIHNHSIEDIRLIRHETGMGKKAETLIDSVLVYQTVELDGVSGATSSSIISLSIMSDICVAAKILNPHIR
jgi:uncharacterized protein with FMN-binding domain